MPRVLFIADSIEDHAHRELIVNACKRAGLTEDEYAFMSIHPAYQPGGAKGLGKVVRQEDFAVSLSAIRLSNSNCLVPLGEYALELVTGLKGINKHHCTIIKARADLGGRKCIPLMHPCQVMKDFVLSAYISFGVSRIKDECQSKEISIPSRIFHLNENIRPILDSALKAQTIAVDCETSNGDVTVIGIALSPHMAVAIDMRKAPPQTFFAVKAVLEGPAKKVFHNLAYDVTCLYHKGIDVNNIHFDTMLAHKLLHPELEKGLDNVARLYTTYPYWKDQGHAWHEANNWRAHLEYNCCDTTATYAAYLAQQDALQRRNLQTPFELKIMQAANEIKRMCTSGIGVDQSIYAKLKADADRIVMDAEERIACVTLERTGERINARSHTQIKRTLKELNIDVPKERGKETVSQKALAKLNKKYPKEEIIPALIRLSKARQFADSLDRLRPTRGRLHYIVDACYNEFGEWSGYNDIWDRGAYPANLSRKLRGIFKPDDGSVFIQASLSQAELTYIAYDAPEPRLIALLNNGDDEPARLYASHVWGKDIASKALLRIADKTILRIAYGIGPRQLMEVFYQEHDKSITLAQSKAMIAKCYELWPGLRRRQHAIDAQIRRTKSLTTAMGRQRVFYDRIGDSLFRKAYQWAARSVVADLCTELMLALSDDWQMLVHGNNYLLGQAQNSAAVAGRIRQACPQVKLAAGIYKPTIIIEHGQQWSQLAR